MNKDTQEKAHAAEAILSLITTAERWLRKEFPTPEGEVEAQSMTELHNQLGKSQTVLENLLGYYRTIDVPQLVQE